MPTAPGGSGSPPTGRTTDQGSGTRTGKAGSLLIPAGEVTGQTDRSVERTGRAEVPAVPNEFKSRAVKGTASNPDGGFYLDFGPAKPRQTISPKDFVRTGVGLG